MKIRFDKARWDALSPLLDELLALDTSARAERLAELRRNSSTDAADLADLLAQYSEMEQEKFLESSLVRPVPEPGLQGQIIGSYTLDSLLGQGGMGTVWLAHRSDGRYEAHVAVKLLNPALLGPGGIERFRREGRALGRLTHPNIARLIDAGVTQTGQPYLVIEYVEGETITKWCDSRQRDVTARVRLFLDVLAAVSHAHGKLILHRDIKPSNILVTNDGQVKLVDFGIAKLLDDGTDATPMADLTHVGGFVFTPEYAAPEQVHGGEATGGTDVYSLGALLYVLLTGRHPTVGSGRTPLERMQAIVDAEPARPSEAALLPPQQVRALRGDLDNIVLKALKKTPAERYPSVEAFGADLRRHLNHQPVSARPDSFAYRAGKFAVRNRLVVGAAAIVLFTIVAAAAVSVWEAVEATRQRDRALALAARNTAVIEFVSVPVVPGATVPSTVNVTWPPDGSEVEPMMLPLPPAGQVAPPLLEHVQVGLCSAPGKVSTSVVFGEDAGPALATTIVYWSVPPAVYAVGVALIATETSALVETVVQLTTARMTQSPFTPRVALSNHANDVPRSA